MPTRNLTATYKHKGGTAAALAASNPILAEREIGVATDTAAVKVGDGATPWNALPSVGGSAVPWAYKTSVTFTYGASNPTAISGSYSGAVKRVTVEGVTASTRVWVEDLTQAALEANGTGTLAKLATSGNGTLGIGDGFVDVKLLGLASGSSTRSLLFLIFP